MIPAPPTTTAEDLADWVEVSCLKSRNQRISKSDTIDQLQRYEVPNAEETATNLWRELDRRSRVLRDRYPFAVEPTRLFRSVGQSHPIYTMLVLISLAPQFSDTRIRNHNQLSKLFEQVVALAVERYIAGKSFRIGHNRQVPVPNRFADLLGFLSRQLGENLRRAKPLNPNTKDCRADVIAWKPFADKRGGQLILLTQCASGTNWTGKLTELNVELWGRYIEFIVSPVRAFAIPFVETNDERWLEFGTLGGIAFDRLRIVEMLRGSQAPNQLLAAIRQWNRAQIARVPVD